MSNDVRKRAIRDVLDIIESRIAACAVSEKHYGDMRGYGDISCATERSAKLELMHVRDLIGILPIRAKRMAQEHARDAGKGSPDNGC